MRWHPIKATSLRPMVQRVTGAVLLLVYLVTATALAPALIALLAASDRSHQFGVQLSETGLQVVLRHECAGSLPHRHGWVARTLTLLAQPPTRSDPDHVIPFANARLSPRVNVSSAGPDLGKSPSYCDFGAGMGARWGGRLPDLGGRLEPCPPDGSGGSLAVLRSTVLLL